MNTELVIGNHPKLLGLTAKLKRMIDSALLTTPESYVGERRIAVERADSYLNALVDMRQEGLLSDVDARMVVHDLSLIFVNLDQRLKTGGLAAQQMDLIYLLSQCKTLFRVGR